MIRLTLYIKSEEEDPDPKFDEGPTWFQATFGKPEPGYPKGKPIEVRAETQEEALMLIRQKLADLALKSVGERPHAV